MRNFGPAILIFFLCDVAWGQDPSGPCFTQLKENERLQALYEKFPFDITKGQSLEILANITKVSSKDKVALASYVAEGDRCNELGAEWRQKNYPASINGLMNTYQAGIKAALADLYAGKLTFGDMAKIRLKAYAETQNQIGIEVQKVQAQRADVAQQKALAEQQAEERQSAEAQERLRAEKLQDEQRKQRVDAQYRYEQQRADDERRAAQMQEEARKQLVLQYLLNEQNKPPAPIFRPIEMPPMPRRITTDCIRNGNYTNCTTR